MSSTAFALVRARRLQLAWHHVALGGILALASLLDFVRLGQNGYANTYYAAAVRSMLTSWRNFFFVSFDSGGLVSVDKPPLALWVEAASVKLFGYSGLTILIPEAIAGVVAVWVLYLLVARFFGRVAGLAAALALAVSPVSVAINRDNNPDALFVMLLVVAAYVGARAVASGRLRTLILAAVVIGLAFDTKMLAAAVVVPGMALAYLLFAPTPLRKRLGSLAIAGIVMVAVSGAWIAAVDLTPASQRPYVGSTTNNSALGLALDYNGLGRVDGQTGGTSFGGGNGGAFSGTPGVFRLLNDALGDQGGWLLAFAIVGGISLLAAAIATRKRRDLGVLTVIGGWFVASAAVFSLSSGIIHTYYLSALAPATSALVGAGAVALVRDARRGGARVLLPLAAVVLSCWLEVTLLRRSGYLPWLQVLVVVATVTAALALGALARRTTGSRRRRGLAAAGALGVAVAALLAAPAAWSATTWKAAVNGVFPGAGPSFFSGLSSRTATAAFGGARPQGGFGRPNGGVGGSPPAGFRGGAPPAGFGGGVLPSRGTALPNRAGGGTGFGGASTTSSGVNAALAYVEKHGPTKRFALIVSSEQEAAPYVIAGDSVAAMGGFTGRETVLTHSYLASLVRSGEARYFLLGGANGFGQQQANAAVTTITSICRQVSTFSSGTLYDCAGKTNAISATGG